MWHHRIPFPDGTATLGRVDPWANADALGLPKSFAGQSVMDIGAHDGGYSFLAEERGASPALAVDVRDASSYDLPLRDDLRQQALKSREALPAFSRLENIRIAAERRNSKIHIQESSVYRIPDLMNRLAGWRGFNHIFLFGVLYHLHNPFQALSAVRSALDGTLYLETEISPGVECSARFYPRDYRGDWTTWWVPTKSCVVGMLEASGYSDIQETDWNRLHPNRAAFTAIKKLDSRQDFGENQKTLS